MGKLVKHSLHKSGWWIGINSEPVPQNGQSIHCYCPGIWKLETQMWAACNCGQLYNRYSSRTYQMENIWHTMPGWRDHSGPMIWSLLDRLSARTFRWMGMCLTDKEIPCCWHSTGMSQDKRNKGNECVPPGSGGKQQWSCCLRGTPLTRLWSGGGSGWLPSEWLVVQLVNVPSHLGRKPETHCWLSQWAPLVKSSK